MKWLLILLGVLLSGLAIALAVATIPLRGSGEATFVAELNHYSNKGRPLETNEDGSWKSSISTIQVGEDIYQKRSYYGERGVERWEIETPTRKIAYESQPGSLGKERVVYDRRSVAGMIGLPGPYWPYQVVAAVVFLLAMLLLVAGFVLFLRGRRRAR